MTFAGYCYCDCKLICDLGCRLNGLMFLFGFNVQRLLKLGVMIMVIVVECLEAVATFYLLSVEVFGWVWIVVVMH